MLGNLLDVQTQSYFCMFEAFMEAQCRANISDVKSFERIDLKVAESDSSCP